MAGDTASSTELTGGCLCGAIRCRATRRAHTPAIEQHPQNRPMPQQSR